MEGAGDVAAGCEEGGGGEVGEDLGPELGGEVVGRTWVWWVEGPLLVCDVLLGEKIWV